MIVSGYLIDNIKLDKLADHSTAATSTVNGAQVDMKDFDGAMFFTSFGTANANNKLVIQHSDTDGSGHVDTTASKASGTSDEDVVVDILHPTKRYVRPTAVRGASSTVESIWCLRYRARAIPQTNAVTGTQAVLKADAPASA